MKPNDFVLKPRHKKRYVVNHESRILYCPIEKNSCTFFKRLLIEQSSFRDDFLKSELDPHTYLKRTGHLRPESAEPFLAPDYLRFVIFREPAERIVSAYMNKFVRSRRYPVAIAATQAYREAAGQPFDETKLLTFWEFVQFIMGQPDKDLDVHWRPQAAFVRHELHLLQWQVPMERIPEFVERLAARIGRPLDAAKTANQNMYGSYSRDQQLHLAPPAQLRQLERVPDRDSLLTPELKSQLETRYAEDFELYRACRDKPWSDATVSSGK